MKITINVNKAEEKHLKNCDSEFNSCQYVINIIGKVKRELNKLNSEVKK